MAEDFTEFIQQVKDANPIEDVIDASGPEYKLQRKRGNYLRGETHNSLVVRVDEGYYTWNSRGEKGDVFNWLEARNKWDFWTSLTWLSERAKIEMPQKFRGDDNQPVRVAARKREDAFGIAQRIMTKWLFEDAEALAYVRARGWNDETIQAAGLGFTGRGTPEQVKELRGEFSLYELDQSSPAAVSILGWRGDVAAWARQHDTDIQHNWLGWGMIPGLIGKTRLVYPHWVGGRVRYFSARNILGAEINKEGREIKSWNLPVALVGKRQPYYNHEYGRRAEKVVVIEGQADAVTLGQWGIPAMALAGTSWDDHAETLAELRKRHDVVFLGLDSDQAGMNALIGADKKWQLGHIVGPMARVVRWPGEKWTAVNGEDRQAKDANDWLQAMQAKELDQEAQVKNAHAALAAAATIVEVAANWAGRMKGADKDQATRSVFGLISKMDKFSQQQYRKDLCELLGINVRDFNAILKTTLTKDEDRPDEIVETLGGYIDGWLIEYIFDPEQVKARFAYRDPEGAVGTADHLDIGEVRYIPKRVNAFVTGGGVQFASDLGQLKSTRELVAIVENFINQHYLMPGRYLSRIVAYYVLLTWVYDAFNAICYLRAVGEAGAGKSELMRRVGALTYRLLSSSGATTAAAFFRATEMYKGTVFIDEADLHDGGDMSNDLVKFLNLGAMKGGAIWRLSEITTENGGRDYEPTMYNAFCPKLIAMRREFKDDAVASRSLTIKLMSREAIELKNAGVRLYIDDDFRKKSAYIRNLLLRWRMHVWKPEIEVAEDHMDLEISARLNQVTMPMKALASDDPELQSEIERFLREYNQEIIQDRNMTIPARIVEAIWRIYILKKDKVEKFVEDDIIYVGDISVEANEIIDTMNQTGEEDDDENSQRRKKDQLKPHRVGRIIRGELQLHVLARTAKGYPVLWDDLKMNALARRYGVDIEQIQALNGHKPVDVTQRAMGL